MKTKKPKLSKEEKKALKLQEKQENHNKLSWNQIIKPIAFIILSVILEFVNFKILGLKRNGSNAVQLFPTYVFFNFAFWIVIAGIMLWSKNWFSNFLFYFVIFFQLILCIANASLYADFGYLFSWDMFMLAMEAIDSFDVSFIDVKSIIIYGALLLVLIAIPIVIDVFFKKKKITLSKMSRPVFGLLSFLCCFFIAGGSYSIQLATLYNPKNGAYAAIDSDKYLYDNMHIKEEAYKRFGTWGFYFKNAYDLTLKKLFVPNKDTIKDTVVNNVVAENPSALLYGDNLICIMLESYEWFAIDPYNTPNLWKLKTGEDLSGESAVPGQATTMNNYFSNNKTNVSEDVALLGFMPNTNKLIINRKDLLLTKYSLPNMFNNIGYKTTFFHNWNKTFYDRNINNINIGFSEFYGLQDFVSDNKSSTFNYFNLEQDFASQFMNKIAPTDKKFMSFYTTVATHGSYEVSNPRFSSLYKEFDANLENFVTWFEDNGYIYPEESHYQDILRQYKTAAMDTDRMVGLLFKHLAENNMLDNTTVLLYADHNAYFHDLSYRVKGTTKLDYTAEKSFTVPMMIYSKKLGARNISTFCNTYDIYPTLCWLFGLEHSKSFTLGHNIFSSDISSSTHVSYLTGYYTDKYYSKNMIDFVAYDGATKDDLELFKKNVCDFYQKQRMIEQIYLYKIR